MAEPKSFYICGDSFFIDNYSVGGYSKWQESEREIPFLPY